MKFKPTPWGALLAGHTIRCPVDGHVERVNNTGTHGTVCLVRTERHVHRKHPDHIVPANTDTGRRDATYRTRWGVVIATRPDFRAPWWLHLPAGWHRIGRHLPTGHRQNAYGAYAFRSQPAIEQWLAPYLTQGDEQAEPAPAGNRRRPGTPPLRRGVYT